MALFESCQRCQTRLAGRGKQLSYQWLALLVIVRSKSITGQKFRRLILQQAHDLS